MDRVVRRGLNAYVYEWILVYIMHNILMLWRRFASFPGKNLQFAILPRNEFGTKLQVGKQAHMLI